MKALLSIFNLLAKEIKATLTNMFGSRHPTDPISAPKFESEGRRP